LGEILKNNTLKINAADNVVITLQPIKRGDDLILDNKKIFGATEDVPAGHKIALENIGEGEKIYRYGEPILEATKTINQGEWVHVHNTRPIPGDLTA
jgi:altronate hydrolase